VERLGKTLKQMILEKIDHSPRGYSEELAKISGSYSSGSNLKKVLKSPDKEFDSLSALLKIVAHIFGKEEKKKLMEQYSTEIDPNHKCARSMLEYLSVNRLLDSLKLLIDRMLECKNKDSREWAKLYKIQYEWQKDFYGVDFIETLNKLNEFKTNIHELNTLINIMKCNTYYKNKMYRMSYELSKDVLNSIENIKDYFIKNSYLVKWNEIMSYLSLRVFNQPEQARIYAQNVLNSNVGLTFKAYANYILGCSYMFTDYDKSKDYLIDSAKMYTSLNRNDAADNVKEEIELLDIMWDKNIFSVYYSKEYKYYWLMRNNKLIYEELENLNIEEQFYLLIKGMKENNTDTLLLSLIKFIKNGDLFLANLPKVELIKRGFSEEVINALLGIYLPEFKEVKGGDN
jgi:hypothetical protein